MSTSLISLPTNLVAEKPEQRAKLRGVIDSAVRVLLDGRNRVRFDFSHVERIFPGGLLVFLAYLEMMQLSYPGRVTVRAPHGSMASQLLRHFGLAQKLGLPDDGVEPSHPSVVNWEYLTGADVDGAKIARLIQSYKDRIGSSLPEGLYDVLAEAFTNVRHHAFPEGSRTPDALKRWWLFSRYVEPAGGKPGYLYIAVYDIGIGIQESLRTKLDPSEWAVGAADSVIRQVSRSNFQLLDRLLLSRAVEGTRSVTGLPNRGLGLPEMRDFVQSTSTGRLYILSGNAQYSCVAAEGTSAVYPSQNAFAGTLILFGIPVNAKE